MERLKCVLVALALLNGCNASEETVTIGTDVTVQADVVQGTPPTIQAPLSFEPATDFKVPLSDEPFNWNITQSWAEHCEECDSLYWDGNSYCLSSHANPDPSEGGCLEACKYSWDFSLPGSSDLGKPVLSSAHGVVYFSDFAKGWGNTVVINHGNNICTRYAHLKDGSIDDVEVGQMVCQGSQIGEIGGTGGPWPQHLHFQFEHCDAPEISINKGFTDGNGVPICSLNGNASAVKLTNSIPASCNGIVSVPEVPELPAGGTVQSSCGSLKNCPMVKNCALSADFEFADQWQIADPKAFEAASYLYSECVVMGKQDGKLHPKDLVTRAEATKVALVMFGLLENCGANIAFDDVSQEDWYFPVVACGVKHGVIDNTSALFQPNDPVNLVEAAKILVTAAQAADVIQLKYSSAGHFANVPYGHWGYPYLETIHYYGGADPITGFYPAQMLRRWEYMLMAASLSPCFCANLQCEEGCTCDQNNYACVDPNFSGSETGGGSSGGTTGGESTGGNDEGTGTGTDCTCTGLECGWNPCGGWCGDCLGEEHCVDGECKVIPPPVKPPENNPASCDEAGNCTGYTPSGTPYACESQDFCLVTDECWAYLGDTECSYPYGILKVECILYNPGPQVLMQQLKMHIADPSDAANCYIESQELLNEVALHDMASGWKTVMPGFFRVYCEELPADDKLDLVFDVLAKEGENSVWHNGAFIGKVKTYPGQFKNCWEPFAEIEQQKQNPPACVPNCGAKVCGEDGCGGSCGVCAAGYDCQTGQCACVPQCDGKACGDDSCGGYCGVCEEWQSCEADQCACVPQCDGKACGDDSCGGTCGVCSAGESCEAGQCACVPQCDGKACGYDSCGGSCGVCAAGESCEAGQCVKPIVVDQSEPVVVDAECVHPEPGEAWQCDPVTGYQVELWFPGGSLEVLSSEAVEIKPVQSGSIQLRFSCEALPVLVLVMSGEDGEVAVQNLQEDAPEFEVYFPYNDDLVPEPAVAPNFQMSQWQMTFPEIPTLFRFGG